MKVRDAMAKTISSARPDSTVQEVAEIMRKEDSGFVPVVEGERLVGVVTDRDIVVRCLAESHRNCLEEAIDHIMSRDVRTIEADRDLADAAEMMKRDEVRRRVGLAMGSVGPTILRAQAAEDFARGLFEDAGWEQPHRPSPAAAERFGGLCAEAAAPIDDVRGTAAYRRHVVAVMARRALARTAAAV